LFEIMKLKNQVALVTGASGGIGSAICRVLAEEGASIMLHTHKRIEHCNALESELMDSRCHGGQSFFTQQADLLYESEALRLVKGALARFSRLDILINNAGWSKAVAASDLSGLDDQLIEHTLRLKINAPLYLIRSAEPFLSASPAGQIINITSVAGIASRGSSIVHAAANAALSSLTRSLARSLAPRVRVNAVAPGFVDTGFVWPAGGPAKAHVSSHNYIGRTVEPEDVAEAVRFLACSASSVTGEELAIDGGIGRLGKNDKPFL
jgi:3-oxoacyl-[acyl-carrier protein] reductase